MNRWPGFFVWPAASSLHSSHSSNG